MKKKAEGDGASLCAWCNAEIPPGPSPSALTAHPVICPRCEKSTKLQNGVLLQDYLDALPFPVVMIGENGLIQTVNEKARYLFYKDLLNFRGEAPGLAFECRYARRPGGCGSTVHCSGCAIRLSIEETFTTGEPVTRRGATLRPVGSGGEKEIGLFISTRKLGKAVLLRIELA